MAFFADRFELIDLTNPEIVAFFDKCNLRLADAMRDSVNAGFTCDSFGEKLLRKFDDDKDFKWADFIVANGARVAAIAAAAVTWKIIDKFIDQKIHTPIAEKCGLCKPAAK